MRSSGGNRTSTEISDADFRPVSEPKSGSNGGSTQAERPERPRDNSSRFDD